MSLSNDIFEAIHSNDLRLLKIIATDSQTLNNIVGPIGDGHYPLHVAIIERRRDILHYFLSIKGININVVDAQGWTPLHYTTLLGSPMDVHILLEAGADFTIRTLNHQETAFEISLMTNNPYKMELLFDYVFSNGPLQIQPRVLENCKRRTPYMYDRIMSTMGNIPEESVLKRFGENVCAVLKKAILTTRSILSSFADILVLRGEDDIVDLEELTFEN